MVYKIKVKFYWAVTSLEYLPYKLWHYAKLANLYIICFIAPIHGIEKPHWRSSQLRYLLLLTVFKGLTLLVTNRANSLNPSGWQPIVKLFKLVADKRAHLMKYRLKYTSISIVHMGQGCTLADIIFLDTLLPRVNNSIFMITPNTTAKSLFKQLIMKNEYHLHMLWVSPLHLR